MIFLHDIIWKIVKSEQKASETRIGIVAWVKVQSAKLGEEEKLRIREILTQSSTMLNTLAIQKPKQKKHQA